MDKNIELDLLRNIFDSSTDLIQVFQAVRDEHGYVIDFIWVLFFINFQSDECSMVKLSKM
jgi:hypothetical protein